MVEFVKCDFFQIGKESIFFTKLSGSDPYKDDIGWSEGHKCGGTYLDFDCQAVQ